MVKWLIRQFPKLADESKVHLFCVHPLYLSIMLDNIEIGETLTCMTLHSLSAILILVSADILYKANFEKGLELDEGTTALHEAARVGSVSMILHLLALGADVMAEDEEGSNPLSYAVG